MTNNQNHPEHAQDQGQPMNIAALLRASADGELTDCQCEQLDAYLVENPEARSQIGFENALKDCCNRAMSKPPCPDALRAKIVAMAGDVPAAIESRTEDQAYAQRIEDTSSYTKSPSFWSRSPMMGIAAALLIVVAGTLFWQVTSFTSNNAPNHLNPQQASYYNRVSEFVVNEHSRCCDEKMAEAKLIEHDISQANNYFSQAFGSELVIPDMEEVGGQVEFYGGGDCHVPSTPRSGHLRFDAITPNGGRIALSLFVSPDPGLLPLEEGITYAINAKACEDAGTRLFAWVNDGIQYLLVSEASDEMCAQVRSLMNAPDTLGSI
jgi:hypothetical protein